MSSTDSSSDEDAANIAVNKGLLFPNVGHKCFMAKDGKKKKVKYRASTKYTTSSDEASSSDDEENLLSLFANLNMQQKEKLNELIGAIHEKDELLDSQEEFLIKENKKHVKIKNACAQEVEKNENLTRELSICHDTISNLRNENASFIARVKKLNVCDDSIANLKNENASLIAKINKLNESRPVYLLIYGFTSRVEVEMHIGSHGCLDGFGILHSKLIKNVLNVFCLANEGSLLELLDLKS
jgi:predicted RNase H-like nuclease (RuvC/YqgF family)